MMVFDVFILWSQPFICLTDTFSVGAIMVLYNNIKTCYLNLAMEHVVIV